MSQGSDGSGDPGPSHPQDVPVVPAGAPGAVDAVAGALLRGEAVVVPTDTVYGVAALPAAPGAAARLYALKGRRPEVPLAVLVADPPDLDGLAHEVTPGVRDLVGRHWPGPLTVVVRRHPALAGWDLGGDPTTIGVRCPDHDLVRAVASRVGPIATTSANRHGHPTPTTAAGAAGALSGAVAVVVDGGRLDGRPSTVVDATVEPWLVRRRGAVDVTSP